MPMITDPDDINQSGENNVVLSKTSLTIELVSASGTALTDAGISGQGLYSWLKEQWKNDATLIPYPFPMISITPEQFEFVEGWAPKDDSSRNLLRNCGWREIDDGGTKQREYMGIITLGSIGAGNTAYYEFASVGTKVPFAFSGIVNQAIKTYTLNVDGTNTSYISDSINIYIRTQGQHYDKASTGGIGLTSLNYIANRFPLAESTDLKITQTDNYIENNGPYNTMTIELGTSISKTINGTARTFDTVVHASGGTLEQVYEFCQWALRQNSDIGAANSSSARTATGSLLEGLSLFIGDTLKTNTGVFVDTHDTNDNNRVIYVDDGGVSRTNAFIAAGNLQFNTNLTNDSGAIYRMFFTNDYGSASAITVNDADGNAISGTVTGSTITFTYDYDNNAQRGSSFVDTPAPVTVVAIGLESAQYVSAEAIITKAVNQNISLVAPLERNYTP